MAPVLKELNEELRGKAIVKFVDVGKNPDAGRVVPLRVIPTQFFFDKDGKPYALSESADQYWVMYSAKDTNEHVFTAHEGGMTKDEILAVLKELGVE
jgi:thioredoxin 1